MGSDKIISIEKLKKYFPVTAGPLSRHIGYIKAVDGVDLAMFKGETLGLVGESGCGKTTLGRLVVRLEEPTEGKILFEDKNILELDSANMRLLRRQVQIVFQDPYSSLNPRKTVRRIVGDPLVVNGITRDKTEIENRVMQIMEEVGLRREQMDYYPHEFSGGQRQRIGLARALVLNPKAIVCDEPVSALDISIQAQVLNLMQDLQEKHSLTFLFISHDLSVVKHVSDRIAVMYLGRVVEMGTSMEIFNNPRHPYLQALISAAPQANPTAIKRRIVLQGDVPSPFNPPAGCHFFSRCFKRMEECRNRTPHLSEVGPDHLVSCFLQE